MIKIQERKKKRKKVNKMANKIISDLMNNQKLIDNRDTVLKDIKDK